MLTFCYIPYPPSTYLLSPSCINEIILHNAFTLFKYGLFRPCYTPQEIPFSHTSQNLCQYILFNLNLYFISIPVYVILFYLPFSDYKKYGMFPHGITINCSEQNVC